MNPILYGCYMLVDFAEQYLYSCFMGMAKYDRLLFILNLLRSRRNLNAARIADECEVTERTIYRDIVALSEANIPIYYDRGYKFASDNFLPPLNFTVNEYLILKTVLESSPLYKSGPGRRTIKSIKTKIEACLTPAVKKEKMFASETTNVSIKSTDLDSRSEGFYSLVENAIKNNKALSLTYDSIESGVTVREVEPYFLIFIERAFYFVAYCTLRKELRTFRIDRIKNIETTNRMFKPRRDIDPAKYFRDSWGVFSGEPVDVEIIFAGKAARIIKLGQHHVNEIITPLENGKIKYRVRVGGIDEICRWIIGFGGDATVIEPEILRREVQARAKNIIKNY